MEVTWQKMQADTDTDTDENNRARKRIARRYYESYSPAVIPNSANKVREELN